MLQSMLNIDADICSLVLITSLQIFLVVVDLSFSASFSLLARFDSVLQPKACHEFLSNCVFAISVIEDEVSDKVVLNLI